MNIVNNINILSISVRRIRKYNFPYKIEEFKTDIKYFMQPTFQKYLYIYKQIKYEIRAHKCNIKVQYKSEHVTRIIINWYCVYI